MKNILLIAFVGAFSLFALGESGREPNKDGIKVKIEIQFPKERYVVSENVEPRIRILNEGSEPIQIPDPFHTNCWQLTYSLKKPGKSTATVFSFRSSEIGDERTAPEDVPLSLITLAPGESVEDSLPLSIWQEVSEPGDYDLSAYFHWKGEIIQSAEKTFKVEPLRARSVSIGIEFGIESDHTRITMIHKTDTDAVLCWGMFAENRPDLGEMDQITLHRILEIGADASDVLCAWTNFSRSQTLVEWHAWREGKRWMARSILAENTQHVELDHPSTLAARPALHTSKGDLDLFVVSAGGTELLWLRFPPNQRIQLEESLWSGTEKPGTVFKRVPLPFPPVQARAALSSETIGSQRHIALIFQEEQALVIGHLNLGNGTGEGTLHQARIVGAKSLPNSEPGLWIDDQGTAHIAVLVWSDPKEGTIALVEVEFNAKGEPSKPIVSKLGNYEKIPIAATVGYRSSPITENYPMKREWALLFEGNHLLHSLSPDEIKPLSSPPALPLELIVRSQAVYLLVFNSKNGYHWQSLY